MNSTAARWIAGTLCLLLSCLTLGSVSLSLAQEAANPTATPAEAAPAAAAAEAPTATTTIDPAAVAPVAPAAESGTPKSTVAAKPVIIPYDQLAYQVSLSLGVDPKSGIPDREAERIVSQLHSLVESRIGIWWDSTVELAPSGEPLNRAMLAARSAASWNEALEPTSTEKKFALTLDRKGTEFRLSGREWDRASQTITPILERTTFDRRLLPSLAAELVYELFRPLVSIDKVEETRAEMRIRGGQYLPPDIRLTPFVPGDCVSGFLRHLGKNRELKRMQVIPWTMVRVDLVERGYMEGTIISAFKSPFAGSRRRIEMLGLKIRSRWPETRVQIIPRGKPQSPMAGYRVEVLDRPETKEDKVTDRITLRTDRDGMITLPSDPSKPIRYLIAYSGIAPLAKAPIYPGQVARLVLEAPDDAPRLTVEAETELLDSELIDIVARREVLMARARGACKKANWEMVTDLEKQVDALPTLDQFLARIETLKIPAVDVAKRNKDKAQESRISRMCKKIADSATLHLDPLKVKEFHTEMDEEKKAK